GPRVVQAERRDGDEWIPGGRDAAPGPAAVRSRFDPAPVLPEPANEDSVARVEEGNTCRLEPERRRGRWGRGRDDPRFALCRRGPSLRGPGGDGFVSWTGVPRKKEWHSTRGRAH